MDRRTGDKMNKKMKTYTKEFLSYIGFWEHINERKPIRNLAVYNWINHDNLNEIIADGNRYWIELVNSNDKLPKYIFKYINNFMKKKGYKYLYE